MKELTEKKVDPDPFSQFSKWYKEILKSDLIEPNAMILATSTIKGKPSLRTVLLKKFNKNGFDFYTNYESRKAKNLFSNPHAEILFLWLELERQVRISGKVIKVSREESEEYFHSRPESNQLGSWASRQSNIIPGRNYLEQKFKEYSKKFKDEKIPLPSFWGGFRLIPEKFEFWQARENRLHDRIYYQKKKGNWEIMRLSP